MKRPNPDDRDRLKRRALMLARHRARRARHVRTDGDRSFGGRHRKLVAPRTFSLIRGRPAMLAFMEKLRQRVLVEREATVIDFSETRHFVANATLLFYAELRRCIELTMGEVSISCRPPKSEKCSQVLQQIGVYDLLGYRCPVVPKFDDVIHWCTATGRRVEGAKYENVLGSYDGRVAEALLDSLFRGLTEAMTNCHHHAYIMERGDGIKIRDPNKNWWMFSQEKEGFLSVVFCDLGAGIPRTLPVQRPALWKMFLGLGGGNDAAAIDFAIESSISRTGKHYRGKGLKQLLEAVQKSAANSLYVFSNFGCYTFEKGQKVLRSFPTSIFGTLIQWNIQLTGSASEDEHAPA